MKRIFFIAVALLASCSIFSQSKLPLQADLVVIQKPGGDAELQIKNATRSVIGYLYNSGDGKVIFKVPLVWNLTGNAGTTPGTHFIGTTDGQALVIKTNNTERMRILSAGNVGIGTSTPSEKLEVNGNILATKVFGLNKAAGIFDDGHIFAQTYDFNNGIYNMQLSPTTLSANRIVSLPNKSGTIAFLDDITGGGSSALSSLTAAVSDNTISNGNYTQVWSWQNTMREKTALNLNFDGSFATPWTTSHTKLLELTSTPIFSGNKDLYNLYVNASNYNNGTGKSVAAYFNSTYNGGSTAGSNYAAIFNNGLIQMNDLANTSTQNRILGQTSSSGNLGYITLGSGLSLSSGVLTSSGGSSQWTTTGSDIYYNTGRAWVGTTSGAGIIQATYTGGNNGIVVEATSSGNVASFSAKNNLGDLAQFLKAGHSYGTGGALNNDDLGISPGTLGNIVMRSPGDIFFGAGGYTTTEFRMTMKANGSTGIGTVSPNSSALLDLSSITKGLLIPRQTTTQRNSIGSPATGLLIFNTTLNQFQFYDGASWISLTDGNSSITYDAPLNVAGTGHVELLTVPINKGGTGQTTATAAANALLPTQTGHAGEALKTDGSGTLSWGSAGGLSFDPVVQSWRNRGSKMVAITDAGPKAINGNLSGINLSSGIVQYSAITIFSTITAHGIGWIQYTQGVYTSNDYNGIGIYSCDASGNMTLMASSTNDGNIWKGAVGYNFKAFSADVSLSPGTYYIGFLYHTSAETTPPALRGYQPYTPTTAQSLDVTNSRAMIGYEAGTALPSTTATSSFTINTDAASHWMFLAEN